MALNRARLISILGFDLLQTEAISEPMCSPSRSQSVHIIRRSARRASLSRLDSMPFLSYIQALNAIVPNRMRTPE
jgi:hypothetical protein